MESTLLRRMCSPVPVLLDGDYGGVLVRTGHDVELLSAILPSRTDLDGH